MARDDDNGAQRTSPALSEESWRFDMRSLIGILEVFLIETVLLLWYKLELEMVCCDL